MYGMSLDDLRTYWWGWVCWLITLERGSNHIVIRSWDSLSSFCWKISWITNMISDRSRVRVAFSWRCFGATLSNFFSVNLGICHYSLKTDLIKNIELETVTLASLLFYLHSPFLFFFFFSSLPLSDPVYPTHIVFFFSLPTNTAS